MSNKQEAVSEEAGITPRLRLLLVFLLFLTLGLALYAVSLESPALFDDRGVFADLRWEQVWARAISPRRFLANLSFAANYYLHDTHVLGYHVFNVLIHVLTAYGLYFLVRLLATEKPPSPHSHTHTPTYFPLAAGLIFLCHPLATQAVTYISQRYTSLAAMFMLWSLAAYCLARRALAEKNEVWGARQLGWGAAAFISAVLAMFCKEYAICLPVLALLMELCFFNEDKAGWRQRLGFLAPLLVAGLIIPLIYVWLPTQLSGGGISQTETGLLPDWGAGRVPRLTYILTEWKVILGTYFRLLLLPLRQNIDHGFKPANSLFEPLVVVSGVILTLILAGAVYLWRKAPWLSFAVIWVYITLGPTSTLVPNTEFVAEHRVYLGLAGFSIVAAWLITRLPGKRWLVILLPYLLALGGLTISRNRLWNDELRLWQDAMAKAPDIPRPVFSVGTTYRLRGEYAMAEKYFRASLKRWPYYQPPYLNLGVVLEAQGKNEEALQAYTETIRKWPDHVDAIHNLGLLLNRLDRLEAARVATGQALKLQPRHPGALFNMAQIQEKLRNLAKAKDYYRRALECHPHPRTKFLAHFYLGKILEGEGALAEALAEYVTALSLTPRQWAGAVFWRIGLVLRRQERFAEAEKALIKALDLASAQIRGDIHLELARLYLGWKRLAPARRHYHQALQTGRKPVPELEKELRTEEQGTQN